MNQQGTIPRGIRRVMAGAVVIGGLLAGAAHAQVLYRWTNEQGRPEISNAIPSSVVHKGYEILDGSNMRVLQVVPPQMSDEEFAAKLEREKAIAACEAALDRVRFLYQSPEDIDNAEAVAMRSIDVRIQNANQNLTNARRRLSSLEADAARRERQGSNVTKDQLAEITRANNQIATLEREIVQREQEKVKKGKEFDEERHMFAVGSCTADEIARR
jgi:hypothetical protein